MVLRGAVVLTTLAAALKGIRAELSDTIREVTPSERVSAKYARFVEHDGVSKGQPIEEISGPARLFEIKNPETTGQRMDGANTTIEHWEIPIVFCYPRAPRWYSVARGDIDKIRRTLINGHGTHGVSGVNSRWPMSDGVEDPIQAPDDPWDYYTLVVTVITETSTT